MCLAACRAALGGTTARRLLLAIASLQVGMLAVCFCSWAYRPLPGGCFALFFPLEERGRWYSAESSSIVSPPHISHNRHTDILSGRCKRRIQYNKRFVNVVPGLGKKRGPNSNAEA